MNCASAIKAPLEPIVVNKAFERLQIDLIDIHYKPSNKYV